MKISEVKINGLKNPVGYSFETVRISWKVEEFTSPKQKNAKIEVALAEDFSGKLWTKEGAALHSFGERIEIKTSPRTRYYVRVTVTDGNGECACSDTTFFETGKGEEAWKGKWIGTETEDTFHPLFEKKFTCKKSIKKARLYICGLGLYEAYLDGKKAGEEYLAPFFNDYGHDVQYQTIDVSEQLKEEKEEHTLSVILGNGWYKGRFGLMGQQGMTGIFGSEFLLIAELHLFYEDGEEEVLGTDHTWRYRGSDIEDSNIYDGEKLNRLLWKEKENPWKQAVEKAGEQIEKKKLTARYSVPLCVNETLPVKEVIHTPAGETVLDFGQNFAGYVEFEADFQRGLEVKLEYGEVLQKGNFYRDNYRTAKAAFTYVSDGRKETVRPHFTFFGGRFVRVSGWPDEVQKEAFRGCVVYSSLDRTGYIETSNQEVNQLASNCLWGQKSNFIDVPTDCPQRDERLGWTGDANVFCATASYNMDTRAFYEKYMHDLRVAQEQLGGAGPAVAPLCGMQMPGGCVWGDVLTFLPDTLYDYYGDEDMLRRHYPMMKDWVDYITEEGKKHGDHHLFDFGFHFADWLALDGMTQQSVIGATDSYYIASCYYYASTKMVARAAGICGYKEEKKYYEELAEQIRRAIFAEYFTANGRLSIDTQTAYYVALKFGIYPKKERILEGLKNRLAKDAYKIKGGFVGATMMCTVLAENGLEEEAIRFLLNEEYPGWLHCIRLGATTIWERWNSLLDDGSISGTGMNSLNHYSYGSVMEYVYKCLGGLKGIEPGFSRVEMKPRITGHFKHFSAVYDSVSGKYACGWSILEDGRIRVHVEVPFGCEAKLILPEPVEGEEEKLAYGGSLEAGSYDICYRPKKDYRQRFDDNSRVSDYATCKEAVEIIKELLPDTYAAMEKKDPEVLSAPLNPQMLFGGVDEAVVKAKERLNQIRF